MPKTVEIDEADLLAQRNIVNTVNGMLANPAARKLLQEAQKAAYPNMAIPELDAAKPVMDELSKEREARLALEARIAAKEAADELKERNAAFANEWAGKKSALARQGYTDEGIAAIEKLAQERGLPDLEAAAALFDKLHPPSEIASPNGFGGFDMFAATEEENKDLKNLLDSRGEDEGALRGLIGSALTDVRSGKR